MRNKRKNDGGQVRREVKMWVMRVKGKKGPKGENNIKRRQKKREEPKRVVPYTYQTQGPFSSSAFLVSSGPTSP